MESGGAGISRNRLPDQLDRGFMPAGFVRQDTQQVEGVRMAGSKPEHGLISRSGLVTIAGLMKGERAAKLRLDPDRGGRLRRGTAIGPSAPHA